MPVRHVSLTFYELELELGEPLGDGVDGALGLGDGDEGVGVLDGLESAPVDGVLGCVIYSPCEPLTQTCVQWKTAC